MADDSNFSLKLVGWASFIEDIMGACTITAGASLSLAVEARMSMAGTEWTARGRTAVFLRMSEAPAILALAGRRAVGSYWEVFTTQID